MRLVWNIMGPMSNEQTFPMALRTGNWGPLVMLPFHKPVTIALAPEDAPGVVLRLGPGLSAVPAELGAAELDRITVSGPGGRPVLLVDRHCAKVEHTSADPDASTRNWELRLEGPDGLLVFYSLGEGFPSAELLEQLPDRLRVAAPVD